MQDGTQDGTLDGYFGDELSKRLIQRLTKYWQDGFDWRKAGEKLNELSHFSVDIPVDGFENLNIHFVHQRNKVETAIPLLFAHR